MKYNECTKAYRFYKLERMKILISQNIMFNKSRVGYHHLIWWSLTSKHHSLFIATQPNDWFAITTLMDHAETTALLDNIEASPHDHDTHQKFTSLAKHPSDCSNRPTRELLTSSTWSRPHSKKMPPHARTLTLYSTKRLPNPLCWTRHHWESCNICQSCP